MLAGILVFRDVGSYLLISNRLQSISDIAKSF